MIFGTLDMKILQICPPHLLDVATLPWEIQKVIFNSRDRVIQKLKGGRFFRTQSRYKSKPVGSLPGCPLAVC